MIQQQQDELHHNDEETEELDPQDPNPFDGDLEHVSSQNFQTTLKVHFQWKE